VSDRAHSSHDRRPRPRSGLRLLLGLAVSLLLNLALVRLVDLTWLQGEAPRREIGLAPLSANDWERNRLVSPAPRPPPSPPPAATPPPPPPDEVEGQVVDIGPAPDVEANDKSAEPKEKSAEPKEARFLAERSSSVEKETRSRHQGVYERSAPVPMAQAAPEGRLDARPDAAPKHGRRAVEERKDLALDLSPLATLKLPQSSDAVPGEEGARDSGSPPAPGVRTEPGLPGGMGDAKKVDLRPRAGLLADLSAGPAPDHLPDVEEGEGTFLNAREWKYSGFMNRMKAQIVKPWYELADAGTQARDPTGERYFYKDRTTVVGVVLDSQGELKLARVLRSSGADFIDNAAVEAFRRAQPFPNPPLGLFDRRGEFAFQFTFVIYGTSHRSFKLFGAPIGE